MLRSLYRGIAIRHLVSSPAARLLSHDSGSDYVWGVHPCAAVLSTRSRRILRVIQDSSGSAVTSAAPIFALAAALGLPLQRVDRVTFSRMFGDASAQGVGMIVERASPVPIDDPVAFAAAVRGASRVGLPPPVVVALDELTDPHNVGAVLRTAQLMGAAAVLVCERNSAPLNGTVSKTSSGALEWLLASERLLVTRHLASLLESLHSRDATCGGSIKEPELAGAWRVVGCSVATAPSSRLAAKPETHVPGGVTQREPVAISFSAFSRSVPTVLVLGNEGRGLRRSVLGACTHTVSAPMHPPGDLVALNRLGAAPMPAAANAPQAHEDAVARLGALDSYNVSVAAAVLLAKLLLQDSST